MTVRRRTNFAVSLVAITTACAPTRSERLPHPRSNPPRPRPEPPAVVAVRRDKLVAQLPPLDSDVPEYAATCAQLAYNCGRYVHRRLIDGYPAVRRVQPIEGGARVRFIPTDFRIDKTWKTLVVTEAGSAPCTITQRGEREYECETTMAAHEVALDGVMSQEPPWPIHDTHDTRADPCALPNHCNPPRPQAPPPPKPPPSVPSKPVIARVAKVLYDGGQDSIVSVDAGSVRGVTLGARCTLLGADERTTVPDGWCVIIRVDKHVTVVKAQVPPEVARTARVRFEP